MFKRRNSRSFFETLKELLWPTMGWVRVGRYNVHRIIRLPATSSQIAGGLATGIAVSFSPFMGTHLIQAGAISYIFRFNVLSSLIGTIIGNPWTFPFIWWASISLGAFLFNIFGLPASINLPDTVDAQVVWYLFWHEPLRILLPWMLGGYLIALVSWPISYFTFYTLVRGAKAAQEKRKLRKLHKTAKQITGQKK